ncbi:TIGR01620 family protein [Rhodovulum sp. BSW8]|uniref:Putative membrane protein n=1 Tax=Rhodovulum visakhapatnamense TaxID=364297 RepID=A0A4R8FZL6_9RHOB|nr:MULTISPECIES: TIGR01620 family protein [Rhodovulum]RBO53503.1 TIGR01620 family protein [Rhodovulum sp. BSW8]TDX28185.1 putative membrane protein [Rhodovulum visakhapatnamense]
MTRRPVVFDLEDEEAAPARPARRPDLQPEAFSGPPPQDPPVSPATAPPVPDEDEDPAPEGRAMQTVAALAARRPSRLARFFWSSFVALLGFVISVAAWNFVFGLFERNQILGTIALTLVGLVALAVLLIALREMAAFARLRRLDTLHHEAEAAIGANDVKAARALVDRLTGFYAAREDTRWGRARLAERRDEIFDADGLMGLAERELLLPLDAAATREIEAAARQVATITAIVPLALADLLTALTANLRMIRRVAEIYGGRGGVLGSIRLARAVMTHLVATGAVAVGDDMIGSIAGGGMLAKVSRRFGEGVVNGALTARVGVAAMEVCRPLPFREARRPSVSALVKRALTGVFSRPDS